jgi:hypothetical protein
MTGAGRRRRKSSPRLYPTPAEMQGLLAQPGTALDPKLTAAWNGRDLVARLPPALQGRAYALPDGRVLVVFMGAGTLYASADAFLEALRA